DPARPASSARHLSSARAAITLYGPSGARALRGATRLRSGASACIRSLTILEGTSCPQGLLVSWYSGPNHRQAANEHSPASAGKKCKLLLEQSFLLTANNMEDEDDDENEDDRRGRDQSLPMRKSSVSKRSHRSGG